MTLTDSQKQQVEQAVLAGNKLEAYRIYSDACQCNLRTAKTEVAQIEAQLRVTQPEHFKQARNTLSSARPIKVGKGAIIAFLLIDFLIFAALIWWFFFTDNSNDNSRARVNSQQQVKAIPSESSIDTDVYKVKLTDGQTFQSLYEEKIDSWAYLWRKNKWGSYSRYDDLEEEPAIKTARSRLAASRPLPVSDTIHDIISTPGQQPVIDGTINENEWQSATKIEISDQHNTTLYFASDGNWLFVACDAKDEVTANGFDQLRVYLHAGLVPELKNERVHLGRNSLLTSIRQTTFRWQGDPPDSDNQRWKKYNISDRGIYRYAVGATRLRQNRQYELAIHLGEAGLHHGIPFTLFVEVETDPLRNEQKKFKKRQYLGRLGNQKNPAWLNIN